MDYSALPPLSTVANLSAYSQGKYTPTDPRIESALDGVSVAIRRYCGWHITPSLTETITLDSDGGTYLDLPSSYVTGVDSVTINGKQVTDFEWSQLGGLIRRRGWPNRYRSVTVTLTHGFDTAPDVERVVLAVASRELASPAGVTREQAGGVSIQYATTSAGVSGGVAFLAPELAILSTYRIVSV